jgi:uncharacterized RDD family membrane protein YckC
MAGITVLKGNNVPHGPFTRTEVADQLNRGEITLESLEIVDCVEAWTPLRDVLAKVDGTTPAPPQAASFTTVPAVFGAPVQPAYSYAATMQPPSHLVYAGFWMRFAAIFIDGLIMIPLSIPFYAFDWGYSAATEQTTKVAMALGMVASWFFLFIGRWLSFALQESSSAQATVGKRTLGIYVTDRQGQRIGFGRATGRYFGKILSGLILMVGFMMAGWTERKQALHDMLADTLVVRRPGA